MTQSFTIVPYRGMVDPNQSADAGPSRHGTQKRLPPEANNILRDYFANVSDRPRISERVQLVARIHAIPGCSWYTEKHVADRASAKRNRESALVKRDKELAHVYEILYPSLRPDTVPHLRTLIKHDPNPTPGILRIWADRLEANVEDVERWISIEQEKHKPVKGSREEEITLPHLPTPEHTASPEPVSPSLGPSSSHAEHLRSGFANSINNVLCSQVLPPPPESIPNSPDEFLKCFELHEQNMLSFLNKIRDGEYELVGLTASDIQPMR